MGAVGTPVMDAVGTPVINAVRTPAMGAVGTPAMDAVGTPAIGPPLLRPSPASECVSPLYATVGSSLAGG
jgi:hypothetical protein